MRGGACGGAAPEAVLHLMRWVSGLLAGLVLLDLESRPTSGSTLTHTLAQNRPLSTNQNYETHGKNSAKAYVGHLTFPHQLRDKTRVHRD